MPAILDLELVHRPIRIGDVDVPNRIMRSAHGTGMGQHGITDDLVAYHEARARGGVGLTVLEDAAVHRSSSPFAGLLAWDDEIVGGFERIAAVAEPHGMRLFVQLYHGGGHRGPVDGSPAWSASAVPSFVTGQLPVAMTQGQIDEIVGAFADAAVRAQAGGLSGVEVSACHGYLIGQFLSRLTNHRSDGYGGSAEGRLRLLVEILEAIRAAVRPGFAVGARLSAEEGLPGGLTVDDTIVMATTLESRGLLDFLNLSLGSRFTYWKIIGAMHEPHGYEIGPCAPIARSVSVPSMVGGRITTLEAAERVLAAGDADMVSMVRATIADPDLVRKSRDGRAAQVRPCIGCNHGCMGGIHKPVPWLGCAVNAAAGRERTAGDDRLEPAATPRSVLVVGGGPAGLEAARVAALRGHRVALHEAAPELGGQLATARRAPLREDIGAIADWLAAEVRRLGVDVRCDSVVDRALVEAAAPDVVVLATGSEPRLDGLQTSRPLDLLERGDDAPAWSSLDVLAEDFDPPEHVVVLDDVGHYEAIAVVDALRAAGSSVTFVTRYASLGSLVESSLSAAPARARFADARFALFGHAQLVSIGGGRAVVRSLDSGYEQDVAADGVVLVCHNVPRTALAAELGELGVELVIAGDALAPRFLERAIAEAHDVARAV
jgi:2,4-dienoyl-CoA reductase-like NADH-dependent reductase (Old Yellow Enzyme family)